MRWLHAWARALEVLAIAALLAMAASAGAQQVVKGSGHLESKNATTRVLSLEDIQVKVVADTQIFDGDGNRIGFAEIPDPSVSGVRVDYQGTLAAGKVEATRIVASLEPI